MPNTQIEYQEAHIEENRQPSYVASIIILLVIAYFSVVLRGISRWISRNKFGIDDFLIGIALVLMSAFFGCLLGLVHQGLGRHSILIRDKRTYNILSFAAKALYGTSIMVLKMSILFLYYRIIFVARWFTRCLMLTGFVVCINYGALLVSMGTLHVLTSIIILLLPVPILLKLEISKSNKLILIGLFGMGGTDCVVAIVRLFYAFKIDRFDSSWTSVTPTQLSAIECGLAILTACMPTYRPLWNYFRHGSPFIITELSSLNNAQASHQLTTRASSRERLSTVKTTNRAGESSKQDDEEGLRGLSASESREDENQSREDVRAQESVRAGKNNVVVTRTFETFYHDR
ncbi:hypothetical protein BJ875DRAFT_517754 [Amylocarpus encephaloides]|uniref:Rhodopsin domain-containing protein n=1 Tax=Amylocarpus encephaloides TaxID=45428 RepID=A0A9P7YDQ8_9HELO|nr:hypothetical protein BJ875DRAFT_517754 [Amylocarpus encephaloides]